MRRHVRHELDRMAELARDFALVHVAGQRVRHQVVAQLVRIVLVRRAWCRRRSSRTRRSTAPARRARRSIGAIASCIAVA